MPTVRSCLIVACAAALFDTRPAVAQLLDVYRTHELVSATPAETTLKNMSCVEVATDRPIELEDVILQAVCANPQTRKAWANARAQAAAVGTSEAAYLGNVPQTVEGWDGGCGIDYATLRSWSMLDFEGERFRAAASTQS
ncbi:hypothetical protein K6W56_40500, partial [Burkholderia contaminans]|nr:hypothetical protein [Burkholderia contaminans]MBY4926382.1 hypothetical protein [Burkholderia contaminans]